MATLDIFVSGVFGKTGEDAYQIGSKNEDGDYVPTVDGVYTKEQAEAALKELAPAPKKEPAKKAAPKKAASKSK